MNDKFSHLKIKVLSQNYQYSLFSSATDVTMVTSQLKAIKMPTAIFISEDEFSIMAPSGSIVNIKTEKEELDWSCFHIVGSMPFGTVQGLIATISIALMANNIGVCVVSTFKSDWFFIRSKYQAIALNILTNEGWNVEKE